MNVDFILDGRPVSVTAHPCERLADILHDRLGVRSVKSGCQIGRCGSCMVILNKRVVPSCLVPAFRVRRCTVTTLEGFRVSEEYRDIEKGFQDAGVESCGFCLAGKILCTHQLMEESPGADRTRIAEGLSGVSCRCTEPSALIQGVERAMEYRRERRYGPER